MSILNICSISFQLFDYLIQRRSCVLMPVFLLAILIGFAGADVKAQSDAPWVKIENTRNLILGDTISISVFLDNNIAGYVYERFSLTIKYDTTVLTFIGGSMGEFVDSCGWESQYLFEQSDGIIQIFAHADRRSSSENMLKNRKTGLKQGKTR